MNIKFRIPRIRQMNTGRGIIKELLLTTLATTISIVLTFGTAHYIDQKDKKAAGRQTAMMVIHDMENSITVFREMSKQEEKMFNVIHSVLDHKDMIDSLNYDTVLTVCNSLLASSELETPYKLDDSSERMFLSSQESWKNIDNASFIDAVQRFYVIRHEFYDYFNNSKQWSKPVPHDILYQHQLNHTDGIIDVYKFLKEIIARKEVTYFVNLSGSRQRQLNDAADEFQHISSLCKFMMGITDEELEEYVKTRKRTGQNIKEKELIGKWIIKSSDEQYSGIEYFDNHTYSQTYIDHFSYPTYTGRVDFIYVTSGNWELRGDTLYTDLKAGYSFKMDKSRITPLPGKEKQVEEFLQQAEKNAKETQKTAQKEQERHRTYGISINASRNKVEMVWKDSEGDFAEEEQFLYLSRQKK